MAPLNLTEAIPAKISLANLQNCFANLPPFLCASLDSLNTVREQCRVWIHADVNPAVAKCLDRTLV